MVFGVGEKAGCALEGIVQSTETDEFILPTGANKTRGRFELAFFTIGGYCMTGTALGQ